MEGVGWVAVKEYGNKMCLLAVCNVQHTTAKLNANNIKRVKDNNKFSQTTKT